MNPNPNGDIWSGINNEVDDMQPGESGDSLNNNPNPENPPDTQAPVARTPTHSDGYSIIPPNESRRSKLQRMAKKELDDLNKWKEEHRPGPIHLAPEKLGGGVSLAEVRQRQQVEACQSKLQKKVSTFCLKLDIHSLKTMHSGLLILYHIVMFCSSKKKKWTESENRQKKRRIRRRRPFKGRRSDTMAN
uniref:Uncharacterized protein n=1 Tax=Pygocentrus nattereri TaxID=42514 RepID=A0AAR2JD49_PYGNA